MNGALGRSLECSIYSLGKHIEGPLWDFLKLNPWPHPRPLGFLAFGLAKDVASGLTLENPLGGPSIFSHGSTLSTLGNLPRDSIHHATSSPFSKIVPHRPHPLARTDQKTNLINPSAVIPNFYITNMTGTFLETKGFSWQFKLFSSALMISPFSNEESFVSINKLINQIITWEFVILGPHKK